MNFGFKVDIPPQAFGCIKGRVTVYKTGNKNVYREQGKFQLLDEKNMFAIL